MHYYSIIFSIIKVPKVPRFIKEKIKKRNRLLRKCKSQPSANFRKEIGNLNAKICTFYYTKKKSSVRNGILHGNSKSLWTAVKLAKDKLTLLLTMHLYYS